jgi:hypothetical protein
MTRSGIRERWRRNAESELELKTNTDLTRQIHTLTTELHRRLVTEGPT